jgi:hypothetical protein
MIEGFGRPKSMWIRFHNIGQSTVYTECVGGVLLCPIGDHILQEFNTLYQTSISITTKT